MKITREIVDKEIELMKMKLDVIGNTNLDFILGILAFLGTLGLSFVKNLFEYWIPATVIIILLLGVFWLLYLIKPGLIILHTNKKEGLRAKSPVKTSDPMSYIELSIYSSEISEHFFKNLILSLWTIVVITFLISYFMLSGVITLEKMPQIVAPKVLFMTLFGFIIISPFVIETIEDVLENVFELEQVECIESERFKRLLEFGAILFSLFLLMLSKEIAKTVAKAVIIIGILFVFSIIITIAFPLWFIIVYFKSIWSTFTGVNMLALMGVTLLLGLVILFELSYLTKHDIRTGLMNSLVMLVNLRQALAFAEENNINIENLGINLEQEYFEAIKMAEFRIAKFLKGIITIYVPNVNYSYILWISKKESGPKNVLNLANESE